jgi:hypothetical protein
MAAAKAEPRRGGRAATGFRQAAEGIDLAHVLADLARRQPTNFGSYLLFHPSTSGISGAIQADAANEDLRCTVAGSLHGLNASAAD